MRWLLVLLWPFFFVVMMRMLFFTASHAWTEFASDMTLHLAVITTPMIGGLLAMKGDK